MAQTEQQEKRPACGWPVPKIDESRKQVGTRDCGSEERVYNVQGRGLWTGRPRATKVCEKHLPDAWKKWNVDSAVPVMQASLESHRLQQPLRLSLVSEFLPLSKGKLGGGLL